MEARFASQFQVYVTDLSLILQYFAVQWKTQKTKEEVFR